MYLTFQSPGQNVSWEVLSSDAYTLGLEGLVNCQSGVGHECEFRLERNIVLSKHILTCRVLVLAINNTTISVYHFHLCCCSLHRSTIRKSQELQEGERVM
jgi:hypothetical protein